MKFELTAQEAQAIVQIIHNLPTGMGAWPLFLKIRGQYEAQLAAPTKEESKDADVEN